MYVYITMILDLIIYYVLFHFLKMIMFFYSQFHSRFTGAVGDSQR